MPQASLARRIAQGEVPTSPGLIRTVGDSERIVLSSVSFHNSSGAVRTVDMWIVPTGESMDASNKFVNVDLQIDGSYRESGIGQVLEPGDRVYLDADGADVSYHFSGATLSEV